MRTVQSRTRGRDFCLVKSAPLAPLGALPFDRSLKAVFPWMELKHLIGNTKDILSDPREEEQAGPSRAEGSRRERSFVPGLPHSWSHD